MRITVGGRQIPVKGKTLRKSFKVRKPKEERWILGALGIKPLNAEEDTRVGFRAVQDSGKEKKDQNFGMGDVLPNLNKDFKDS